MAELFRNFAATTLAAPMAFDCGEMELADPEAFPPLYNVGDHYHLVLEGPGGEREVVRVERAERGTDLLRAQQGTEARDWPAGTPVEMRLTAETLGRHEALIAETALLTGLSPAELAKRIATAFCEAELIGKTTLRLQRINGGWVDVAGSFSGITGGPQVSSND
jgi:hypothetical protein